MSLYEGIKDVAKVVQKADNIELYQQLLDLSQQALDMQEEIRQLKQEIYDLKKKQDLEDRIVRHETKKVDSYYYEHPYITLSGDTNNIRYCAICWGRDRKLIQLYDELNCMECNRKK